MEWDDIFGPDAQRHLRPAVSAVLQTLQTAAETEPPVSFIAAHMSLSCAGHLRAADAQGVTIELPNPPEGSIEAGALAAIRFPRAGKAVGFTSAVQTVERLPAGGLRLNIALPTAIRADEQRTTVRIPIPDGTLAAALLDDETPVPVRAIDISLSGMGIELKPDTTLALELGHRRMIVLKLGRDTALIEIEVRRQDARRYGLAFVHREQRPPRLAKIIGKLQSGRTAT